MWGGMKLFSSWKERKTARSRWHTFLWVIAPRLTIVASHETDPELKHWKELAVPVRDVPVLVRQNRERIWAPRVM